ncbi:hypothetical protein GQX74_012246 [Glossina fuscipes]|nr:hypothetical protein GQX74_012246 [Glossina fuscipes]
MLIKFLMTPFAINILLLLLTIGLAKRIQTERITVVTPEAIAFKVDNNVALAANSSVLTTTERLENSSYLTSKEKDFIQDINSGNMSSLPAPTSSAHLDVKPGASTHSYINFDLSDDDDEEKNVAQTDNSRQTTIKEVLTNLFPKGFSDIFRFSYNPEPPEDDAVEYIPNTTGKAIDAITTIGSTHKTKPPSKVQEESPVPSTEPKPKNITISTSITREIRREVKPGHVEIVIEKITPNQGSHSSEEFKDGSNYISKDDLLRINRAAVDSPVLPSLLLSPNSSNHSSKDMNISVNASPIVILNSHSADDFEDVVEDDNQLAESQRVMHQVQPPESLHYQSSAHHDINIHVIHDDKHNRGHSQTLDRKPKPFFTPAAELKDEDEQPVSAENRTTTYSQLFTEANRSKAPEVIHVAPPRKTLRNFKPIYHRSKPTAITKGRFHYEHLKRPTADVDIDTTAKLSDTGRLAGSRQFQESKLTSQEYDSELNSESSEISANKSRGKQRFYYSHNVGEESPNRQNVNEPLLGPIKYEKAYIDEESEPNTEKPSSATNEVKDAESPQYEQANEAAAAEQPAQIQNAAQDPAVQIPVDNYENQNDLNAYIQIIPTTSSYQQQPSEETRSNPQSLFQFNNGLPNKNGFSYGSPTDPYAFIQVIPPQPQFSHPNPTVSTNVGYLHPPDYLNNRELYNTVNGGEKDQQSVTPISLIFVTINSPLSAARESFATSSPTDLKSQSNENNEEQSDKVVNDDNQTDSSNKNDNKPNTYTFVEVQKSINIHNKLITEKDGRVVESHETIYPQQKSTETPPLTSNKKEGTKDYGSLTKNPIRVADSEAEESKKVFEATVLSKEEQRVSLPTQEITEVEPIQQAQVIHEAHTIGEVSKGKESEALFADGLAGEYDRTLKFSEPQSTQQYSENMHGSAPYIQRSPDPEGRQYEETYKGFGAPSSQGAENSYISQNIQEIASEGHNNDLYQASQEELGQSGVAYPDNIGHHEEAPVYQDENESSNKFSRTTSPDSSSQVLANAPNTQTFPDNSLQTLEYNNHEEIYNHPLPLRLPYTLASPQAHASFPQHMSAPYSLPNHLGASLTAEQSNERPYPLESIVANSYPVEKPAEKAEQQEAEGIVRTPVEKIIEKYASHPVAVPIKMPVALQLPSTVNPQLHYHTGLMTLTHPNALSLPYGSVITSPTLARIPVNLMNTYYNNMLRKLVPDMQSSFKSSPPFGRAKTIYRFIGPKSTLGSNLGIKLDLKPPPRQLPKPGFDPDWDKGARYAYNYNTLPWDLDVSSSQAITKQIEHLPTGAKQNIEEYLRWRNGQLLKRSPMFAHNLHMEYGFKPPLVPSLEIDEKGVPLKAIDEQVKGK